MIVDVICERFVMAVGGAAKVRRNVYLITDMAAVLAGVFFVYALVVRGGALYLPPFGCALGKVVYIPAYAVSLWVWYWFLQKRIDASDGLWEMVYLLFPVEVCALLFFAQWHFWAAVGMAAVCGLAAAYIYVAARRRFPGSAGRRRAAGQAFRLGQLLFFLAALVVGGISMFGYHLQSPIRAQALEHSGDYMRGMCPEPARDLRDYDNTLRCFHPSAWMELDEEQRLGSVQALADILTERLEIGRVRVQSALLEPDVIHGEFDGKKTITIDRRVLAGDDVEDSLEAVCHEVYHAYQHTWVERAERRPVISVYDLYAAYVWQENEKNYISAQTSPQGYVRQPLETSAEDYAIDMTAEIQALCMEMQPPA